MSIGLINIIEAIILPLNLILVVLAVEFMTVRETKRNDLYYLFIYSFIVLVLDFIQYYLSHNGENNLFINHIITPIEFFLLAMTLRSWEVKYKELYTITIVFVTTILTFHCIVTSWLELPLGSMVGGSIVLLIGASRSIFVSDFTQKYRFLISFGIFLYSGVSAFIYPFYLENILSVQLHIYITELTYILYIIGVFSARLR